MELPTVSPLGRSRYEVIGGVETLASEPRAAGRGLLGDSKKKTAVAVALFFATIVGGFGLAGRAGILTNANGPPCVFARMIHMIPYPCTGVGEANLRCFFRRLGLMVEGSHGNFDSDGRFILANFDQRKPFSSFLPGIGGEWGLPIWAFYVNRGQAVASFGTSNKDNPLSRFETANVAYQTTPLTGFRTVLKVTRNKEERIAQPFFEAGNPNRTMMIGMNELEIIEYDNETGIETRILYFTVPGEDFAALVRRVTFKNVHPSPVILDVVDGLAQLEPFGVNNGQLASMGRTLEGWMNVYNCQDHKGACTQPFFKLSASTADSAQVQRIVEGNFALSFVEGEEVFLPIIVDPTAVFGIDTTLRNPDGFVSIEDLVAKRELKSSQTPSAFSASSHDIAVGEAKTVVTVYGRASSLAQLTDVIAPAVMAEGFVPKRYNDAVDLTERLTSAVHSSTANPLFDAFSRQMMLDNLLRGGYPEFLGESSDDDVVRSSKMKTTASKGPRVYHTFSRIHGDLERDYNNFQIDASYFSQGSGNYRDVNQNRRVDVLLFPEVGDFNLRQFLTLKQADGYNPLTVQTAFFVLDKDEKKAAEAAALLAEQLTSGPKGVEKLAALLTRPFRPGQLFLDAKRFNLNMTLSREAFLNAVASASEQVYAANYTHEGFWADHWTYDLDQVESFEAIFPDRVELAMWDAEELPFYMSGGTVQARDFKYVEVEKGMVRQYNSVYDNEKKQGQLNDRNVYPDGAFQLKIGPHGSTKREDTKVYTVSPMAKLVLLCVCKFALLDPSGLGIEMEANKPGWNDAMNGLPGLLGSGMAETCETLRLARWILKTLRKFRARDVVVPAELADHITHIDAALKDTTLSDFDYWDKVSTSRERYRKDIDLFFSGRSTTLTNADLIAFLDLAEKKLVKAIEKAISGYSPDGVILPSYFAHEVVEYDYTGIQNYVHQPFVRAKKFKTNGFPLFLEGPVRQLKTVPRGDREAMKKIHDAVLASPLYDAPIAQYKICESLAGQPFEMGRMMAFTPGWLENESIWLHMSFKYYLELLRGGLFEQFWTAMETGAPYNMDVETYGRSPIECSSFVVSSAYPNKDLWGTGFLARLSGSTAEFLSMWLLAMFGPAPFVDHSFQGLQLALRPALPATLFKKDKTVSFVFLGRILVTYHNPNLVDTWTALPSRYDLTQDGDKEATFTLHGPNVPSPHAEAVRDFKYDKIDVYFD